MTALDPLALATLGIGFHPTVSARVGLWAVPQSGIVKVKKVGAGGGKGRYDAEDEDQQPVDDEELLVIIQAFLHLRGL